jgi:hypothetical protein
VRLAQTGDLGPEIEPTNKNKSMPKSGRYGNDRSKCGFHPSIISFPHDKFQPQTSKPAMSAVT